MLPIRRLLHSNSGSAGILALIAMVFFGILGGAYVTFSNSNIRAAANLRDGVAAQYLAEAGAQWAIAKVTAMPSYREPVTQDVNTGAATAGTYTVTITHPDKSPEIIIESVGKVNQSKRIVVLHLLGKFTYGTCSNGDITIDSAKIRGNAGSNKKITVSGHQPNTIEGSAECQVFDESSGNNSQITVKDKVILSPAPKIPLGLDVAGEIAKLMTQKPLFTTEGIPLQKDDRDKSKVYNLTTGSYYFNGSYTIPSSDFVYHVTTNQPVILYVNGDFTIGKNIICDDMTSSDLTIYVSGNLTFTDKASILSNNSNTKLKIYVDGNIECNSTVAQGEGLVVAKGNIKLNGQATGQETIFFAGGNMEVNDGATVGALYSNGNLDIHKGVIVDYWQVQDLAHKLSPPTVISWDDH